VKILIAEDEPISRRIIRSSVEGFGHECLSAEDGLEAWELFQNTREIDVIISDWMMPGIDGLEFCRRVRATDRPGYAFFIFLTALGDTEHLLEGMQAGADEYLTKPLDTRQLEVKLIAASRVTSAHRHLNVGSAGASRGGDRNRPATESAARTPGTTVQRGTSVEGTSQGRTRIVSTKVWDVLLSEGKLSEEQLHQALDDQTKTPGEIGKSLVSLGFISEADLARAQAERLNLDYLELTERDVDPRVIGLVPERVLRKHDALPLYKENEQLVVAMSDPTNLYALEDLRMISGHPLIPVVVTEDDLRRTQDKLFAAGEAVAEILQDAAGAEIEDPEEVELGTEAHGDEAPVVRLVSSILQQAVADGASDIHLEPRAQDLSVRFRIDGILREIMSIPQKLRAGVIARMKVLANLDVAERRVPQDGRFSVRLGSNAVDLRVASLPAIYGEEMVLRLLDTSKLQTDLTEIGLDERDLLRYEEVFRRAYGTILVTGPTGSGKSTTLYATLNELNSPERKIITVEDPVEYRMQGIVQVQVNPKAGLTFASGLRSILRSDPDVVMIGEIRDSETARISVEAALTGHLVLATLHTNDAPGALTRLMDMGVEPFLAASAVDCVVAQRLARRLCERCKQPAEIDGEILVDLRFPFELASDDGLTFHKAVGCGRCGGLGYRGRIGVYEIMVVTEEIKGMILRRASTGEISRAAEQGGMVRLREDGLLKAARGATTIEEVLRTVV
jgi:type IV pilus assembly protein PilB